MTSRAALTLASRVVAGAGVVALVGMLPWISQRDPALSILRARSAEQEATPEALDSIRRDLGLDGGPVAVFGRWFGRLVTGDPGTSWNTGRPVLPEALSALGVSLTLMGFALVVAAVVAAAVVLPSIRSGVRGTPRRTGGAVAAALTTLPEFLLASTLVVVGAVWLSLPAFGWGGPTNAVLPALAMGIPAGGLLGRLLADAVAVTFTEDWVTTWTVAGFSRGRIVAAVLRRATASLTSQIGLVMVGITGGAVAVEKVFAIPGLGRATLTSASAQDIPALQINILLLLAVSVVLGSMAEVARRLLLGAAARAGSMPIPTAVFRSTGRRFVTPAVALAVLLGVIGAGLVRDPSTTSRERFVAPSVAHPFGTDAVGRDLLARVAHGAVSSIGTAALVTLACLAVGLLVGLAPNVSRGAVEIGNAAPTIVTGIVIAAVVGPSAAGAAVAVLLVSWAPLAAHTSALIEEVRLRPYVAVLPTLGAGRARILFGTVLPAVIPAVARHAALRLPGIALALAALGFLGLGPQPPAPEWGLILADGVASVERAPWVVLAPLVALVALSVLAVSLSSAVGSRAGGPDQGAASTLWSRYAARRTNAASGPITPSTSSR